MSSTNTLKTDDLLPQQTSEGSNNPQNTTNNTNQPPPDSNSNNNRTNTSLITSSTSQVFNAFKYGLSDARLAAKHYAGQITESEDDNHVIIAFQKLETYREQITQLLKTADNWTKAMANTWNCQSLFMNQLNECNVVIESFHKKPNSNENENKEINEEEDILENGTYFSNVVKGISTELSLDQKESERKYAQAAKFLVEPLTNILQHEIMHAVDVKHKYMRNKRQYDDCCTRIKTVQQRILDIDHPEVKPIGALSKFKRGFSKLVQSNANKEELEIRLKNIRMQLQAFIKTFDESKKQLLESIGIIEEKLNVEVVYYVQQFYEFVQSWKEDRFNRNKVNDESVGDDGSVEDEDGTGDDVRVEDEVEDDGRVEVEDDDEEELGLNDVQFEQQIIEIDENLDDINLNSGEDVINI